MDIVMAVQMGADDFISKPLYLIRCFSKNTGIVAENL